MGQSYRLFFLSRLTVLVMKDSDSGCDFVDFKNGLIAGLFHKEKALKPACDTPWFRVAVLIQKNIITTGVSDIRQNN